MQVRHLPNRDHRRNGVTILKCASAHVPRFLTGSDASNKPSATPLQVPGYQQFLPRTGGPQPGDGF